MTEQTMPEVKKDNAISLLKREDVIQNFQRILWKKANGFIASVLSIISNNDYLKNADPASVYNAAMIAASFDLPINPNLGFAYIVPYNNKKTGAQEAQFQMWYKWYQQLAIRTWLYRNIVAKPIYDGQIQEEDSFIWYSFNWKNKLSDKVVGYASYFELLTGFSDLFFMSSEEVEKHAKEYSQTYKKWFGNWKDNFDKMALKTVTKLQLNSWKAPLSIEIQNAIIADQAIIRDADTMEVEYPDNPPLVDSTNNVDPELLQRWENSLSTCKTPEEVNKLMKENKPTDPTILALFTKRHEELSTDIQN